MKKILSVLVLMTTLATHAQKVDGYWYGNATVAGGGSTNNYLVELIISQNGPLVDGIINYYFKNSFRSFKLKGSYNAANRQLQINNIPITYYASTEALQVDCMMDFIAQLRVAKAGSNLNGRFVGKPAYRYTCPEIMFNIRLSEDAKQDSVLIALQQFKETYQLWTPASYDTAITATIQQRPIINYVVANEYKERKNVVSKEIEVTEDSVLIDIYDNGEVDGDSVSIFFNDKLLASAQKLTARSIRLKIALDKSREYNEIAMFADNLGSIPPNTALMMVTDGKKRYEVRLTSTLVNNGTVRIRTKK